MNKKEDIIQMLKDNPIKIIKCGDIEIPVEYLRQTTVNVNGDDYIRVQRENKQLKDNWDKLREWLESNWEESQDIRFVKIINKMQELEQGSDKK